MYTMQDLLQDGKVVMSRNMHGNILKMQKICGNTGKNVVVLGDGMR